MKYYKEFETKFGFNDGESIPNDAPEHRQVYVQFLNAIAEKLGSTVRAIAWDRPGCHNPYLILLVPADKVDSYDKDRPECVPSDEAWDQAEEIAEGANLDDCIETKVTIKQDYLAEAIRATAAFL